MPVQIKSEPPDEPQKNDHANSENQSSDHHTNCQGMGGTRPITTTVTAVTTPQSVPARSHSSSLQQKPNSSQQAKPTEPPPIPDNQIDIASIKGVFGWATVDSVNVPYIFRNEKKFVSVRIVELKLLSRYPNSFPDELGKRDPLTSYFITNNEAKLLNEINMVHCGYEYGKKSFTIQDLIVNLSEFERFYQVVKKSFLEDQQNMLQKVADPLQVSPNFGYQQYPECCGWLQINNTVTPYVERVNGKHMPLSVIRYAAGLLVDRAIIGVQPTKKECDMLNDTCRAAGFNFSFIKSTKLVNLSIVKLYHQPLIIELPRDNPLQHAKYIDLLGSAKNPIGSNLASFSQFPPPPPQGLNGQAMHPFPPPLQQFQGHIDPHNPVHPGNVVNRNLLMHSSLPHALQTNFSNSPQQMPLQKSLPCTNNNNRSCILDGGRKLASSSGPQPTSQAETNLPVQSSPSASNRIAPATLMGRSANPSVFEHAKSNQNHQAQGSSLHVLKSYLNKNLQAHSPASTSILPGPLRPTLTQPSSQNLLGTTMPNFSAPLGSSPGNLYMPPHPRFVPVSQAQCMSVWSSITPPGSFPEVAGQPGTAAGVPQMPPISYPPLINIPVTSVTPLVQGPPGIFNSSLAIPPSPVVSMNQQASLMNSAKWPLQSPNSSPSIAVSSQAVLFPSLGNNNTQATAALMQPLSAPTQTINLAVTQSKFSSSSSQSPAAAASQPTSPPPHPPPPPSPSSSSAVDQNAKQANSALVQHITSIFLRGKSISCISSPVPGRIGSYALVEAVCKLYFSDCGMNEFLYALENVLQVPLTACTDEEEKAFIQYYSLPVTVLKCNKMINLTDLESYFPQLLYMFSKSHESANVSIDKAEGKGADSKPVQSNEIALISNSGGVQELAKPSAIQSSNLTTPAPSIQCSDFANLSTFVAVPLMSVADAQRLLQQKQGTSIKRTLNSTNISVPPKTPRRLEQTVQKLHQTQVSPSSVAVGDVMPQPRASPGVMDTKMSVGGTNTTAESQVIILD